MPLKRLRGRRQPKQDADNADRMDQQDIAKEVLLIHPIRVICVLFSLDGGKPGARVLNWRDGIDCENGCSIHPIRQHGQFFVGLYRVICLQIDPEVVWPCHARMHGKCHRELRFAPWIYGRRTDDSAGRSAALHDPHLRLT